LLSYTPAPGSSLAAPAYKRASRRISRSAVLALKTRDFTVPIDTPQAEAISL